jgi:hypothetical protein
MQITNLHFAHRLTTSLFIGVSVLFLQACGENYYFDTDGNANSGVTVDGERISGLKVMRPEVLSDMLNNAFGERYGEGLGEDETDAIMDTNYKLYLGGLDYEGIIDRPEDLSPTNSLVIRRLALDYCAELIPTVPDSTFLTNAGLVGNSSDVNEVIGDLYRMVRSRPIDSTTAATARTIYEDVLGDIDSDGPVSAWRAVCIFLFLSEGGISMY